MQNSIEKGKKYLMNNYNRLPIQLVEGKGSRVYDSKGRVYLDFLSGIAVNALGHCPPELNQALCKQAEKLWHCSNIYWIEPQIELAEMIAENTCADKLFFCNSGAEANEAAIKLARKWGGERHEIIALNNSFHGRTLGALAATGQEKYRKSFEPLPQGFVYADFNNLESVQAKINEKTCAVMVEVIQGEGGLNLAESTFLEGVQEICREQDLLLIVDEVQTGIGRTGKPFAYQNFNLEPDIITLAKALGGGFPIGAMAAKDEVAKAFEPGDHAATFGGNPLACAVAVATLKTIFAPDFLKEVNNKSEFIRSGLSKLQAQGANIVRLKGLGLMLGCELKNNAPQVAERCLELGLLLNVVGGNTLRIVPPLNITEQELAEGLEIIEKAIKEVS